MEPHNTSAARRYDWKRFDFIIVCFCILMSVFVGAYIFWRKSLNFKLKALPVELLVGDVGALQGDAVSPLAHHIAHRGIVGELGGDILLARGPAQTGEGEVVFVHIVTVILQGELVAAMEDIAEVVASVGIEKEVGDVGHALSV